MRWHRSHNYKSATNKFCFKHNIKKLLKSLFCLAKYVKSGSRILILTKENKNKCTLWIKKT